MELLNRPSQYDTSGKFLSGANPRATVFPKGGFPKDKSQMGPGPGSYGPMYSMGKQVLSTKDQAPIVQFGKAPRPSMVAPGTTEIGPGQYQPPPAACEMQVDSRKPTCGKIKFGEGYRSGSNKLPNFDFSEPSPG